MGWWRRARHSSSEKPTFAEQLNPSVDAVFLAGRRENPCNDYVLFILSHYYPISFHLTQILLIY